MSKVSIIVPALNEAVGIASCLEEITRLMSDSKFDYEVIVIDDGSNDGTYLVSNNLVKNNAKIKLIKNNVNLRKGHAVKKGLRSASGDFIAFTDADFSMHPKQFTSFLSKLKEADAVIGSKRNPKPVINYPSHRKFLSRGFNLLVRMYPMLLTKSYTFDVELLINVYRQGYRIVEAPIILRHWKERLGVRDILRLAIDLLPIFYRFNPSRSYVS